MTTDLQSRAATAADLPAILDLLRRSMGRSEDARFDVLFRWKHLDNVFGASPMWIAVDGDRVVGLRTFMRWEFVRAEQVARCVRAVDTATHPDYQGRGIFTRLTLDGVAAMEAEGVDFVFNTPNTQSRPGYLKMGWQEVGRARACVRPLSLAGAVRLARNRVPAAHWSDVSDRGEPAGAVIASPEFSRLRADLDDADDRYRTRTDGDFFAWRYGRDLLAYRAVVGPGGIADGVAFVRVRRRGDAREVVLAALLTPSGSAARTRPLLREVIRCFRGHADYLLGVGSIPGCLGVPSFGPVVTTRDVASHAPRDVRTFDLALGDLELF